jgi:hypothetical protein
MKHFNLRSIFLGVMLAITPVLCFGNGFHVPGTVTITGNVIEGSFSVRYNSAVSQGQIGVERASSGTSAPGNIAIYGSDSSTNAGFYCYATYTDIVYKELEQFMYAAGNGSHVQIERSGYKCIKSVFSQDSAALD